MVAVESSLSRMVKTAPTPTAPAVSADDATTKPETTTMAEPIIAYTPVNPSANRTSRPLRVHTESERLAMAGQTAFGNMMELATKYPDAYGFQAGDFLSDAKLGAPMPVYTITEADRASYQAGQSVKSLLKPSRQWVFPVLIGDRLCCMVQVKQNGHEFIPGKSNKSLAMAWNKIQERWPTEEGYHPLLVVNPDVPGYYFTVPELPQPNITDVIEMFFIHPGISPADVILASWR